MIYGCGLLIVNRSLQRKRRYKLNKSQLKPRAVSGWTFGRFRPHCNAVQACEEGWTIKKKASSSFLLQ